MYVQEKLFITGTGIQKLGACLKKKGKKIFKFPIFDNEFLSSSKQLKTGPNDCVFTIKHEEICDHNPQCSLSCDLMLDDIIMNLFFDATRQKKFSVKMIFPK